MNVHERYVPRPPLSTFIEAFWLHVDERPPHLKERRLPDGSIEMVIPLTDAPIRVYDRDGDDEMSWDCRGGVLSGPQSRYLLLDTTSLNAVIGVSFRPGGVLPFLPFPASELHDQVLSLETLWGAQASDLHGSLREAATPVDRFAILEQFLLRRLVPERTSHPAFACAVRALEDTARFRTVASVAEYVGLSQTRFVQVFRAGAGMTPKQYARLCRFQRALHLLESSELATWADVVVACDYFDQAHVIHEFQAFAGLTPSTYLALRGTHRNHVPLLR